MNDTELTIINLPNGVKAYLKPFFTRKDYNTLMQILSQKMQVDAKNNEVLPVPLSVSLDVQDKALEIILVKIVFSDGSTAPNPLDAVNNMNNDNVSDLFDKIDELTTALFNSKKN